MEVKSTTGNQPKQPPQPFCKLHVNSVIVPKPGKEIICGLLGVFGFVGAIMQLLGFILLIGRANIEHQVLMFLIFGGWGLIFFLRIIENTAGHYILECAACKKAEEKMKAIEAYAKSHGLLKNDQNEKTNSTKNTQEVAVNTNKLYINITWVNDKAIIKLDGVKKILRVESLRETLKNLKTEGKIQNSLSLPKRKKAFQNWILVQKPDLKELIIKRAIEIEQKISEEKSDKPRLTEIRDSEDNTINNIISELSYTIPLQTF